MEKRYKPTKNTTFKHFVFHKMHQNSGERFDDFANRVKQEAEGGEFTCESKTCNVRDVLVRDQLLIGTSNEEIWRNGLKEQWGLGS